MALLVTVRKAVLPHSCDTCGQDIPSGKHYIRLFYTRDEKWALRTLKECADCAIFTGRAARLKAVAAGTVKPKPRKRRGKKAAAAAPPLATGGVVTGRPQTINASALDAMNKLTTAVQAAQGAMPAVVKAVRALSVAEAARQRAFGQAV